MQKYKLLRNLLLIVLCVAMVLPYVPMRASASTRENFDVGDDFKGLKMSVLGDSISTFDGYSNNKTYNPLYMSTSAAVFDDYYNSTIMPVGDTWWMRTADTLGMELLVNNSWSGSRTMLDYASSQTTLTNGDFVTSSGTAGFDAAGYKDRCVNLHVGTTMPDVIAVFLGTNDVNWTNTVSSDARANRVGSKADIDTASERTTLYTSLSSYATPTSSVEAYYIMVSKMTEKYPDAEIYCVTPFRHRTAMGAKKTTLAEFNEAVGYIATLFENVNCVDLDSDMGITDDAVVKDYYYRPGNQLHPDADGMAAISSCLLSEILEHSKHVTAATAEVSYDLDQAFVDVGLVRRAVIGKPFAIDLLPYEDRQDIAISVTMKDAATGAEVEIPGLGFSGHSIYIPSVTGPVTITAKADKNDNYYWKAGEAAFAPATGNGITYNRVSLLSGSYTGGTDTGTFTGAQYSLAEPVLLQYDKPWELEFKAGGAFSSNMLLSNTQTSSGDGNVYIFITTSNVLFGYRDSYGYNNSGILWSTIASKLGSSAGADIRKETHVFRFVNEPNGTNNQIYLYVDGIKIGAMDANKYNPSNSSVTSDSISISGKDFEFNYMGGSSHLLDAFSLSYLKVWENGEAVDTQTENFRWELSDSKNAFVTVDDDRKFTENNLELLSGSVSNGTFTGTYFEMDKQVVLLHDQQWKIEWTSSGSWIDNRNGGMLLSTTDSHTDLNAYYLYRRHNSEFIAIGEWKNSQNNNYGIRLADYGIDGSQKHKYVLANEVSTGEDGTVTSNMVYLYVDDVKIGAMDTYFVGGATSGTKSDWMNGKDFVFSYIGSSQFTVGNCSIDYLQVSVDCSHSYETVTTAPTCTEAGYTTHTCTQCGESYTDSAVAATGHSYSASVTAPTCTAGGYTTYTCSICGDSYTGDVVIASGHMWNEASCAGAKTCSICGQTEGEALRHSYYAVITAPTCTDSGYTTYTCSTCSDSYVSNIVSPTGHSHESAVTKPTCTDSGYTTYTCTACGSSYISNITSPTRHSYSEGFCTACGEKNPDYLVIPTLTLNYPSLSFEDEILYNVYYGIDDTTSVVEMGLVTFTEKLADGTIADAIQVIPGYVNSGSTYMVQSKGIPAKNLSDAVYFKVYAKLTDGSYVYTEVAGYNAVAYANTVLNNAGSSAKAKALVVAMLNYGAAAQEYFGYKTDSLMNASLTAQQQALVSAYDDSMVADVVKADSSKVGSFVMNGGYSNIFPTVSFEGAFAINFYFAPNKAADSAPVMYYWDAATYNSVSKLTAENATGVITMAQDGSNWGTAIEGIAAKAIDETIYVAGFYTSGGVSYPTNVIAYSLGNYCKTVAANGNAFGAATAVYGYYAKAYFN